LVSLQVSAPLDVLPEELLLLDELLPPKHSVAHPLLRQSTSAVSGPLLLHDAGGLAPRQATQLASLAQSRPSVQQAASRQVLQTGSLAVRPHPAGPPDDVDPLPPDVLDDVDPLPPVVLDDDDVPGAAPKPPLRMPEVVLLLLDVVSSRTPPVVEPPAPPAPGLP
jgi:hypothetical protein